MRTIRLFVIGTAQIGTQFILKDYPDLQLYRNYAKRTDIKRLNMEQYFRGLSKDYKDYVKLIYGPVFGFDDPRNGFIYEHVSTGELIVVDENDIPITYEVSDVIMGDLCGMIKVDDNNIKPRVITSYYEMAAISDTLPNPENYNDLIRDEWVMNKSFLIIE